jgi:hypothetical protein
MQVRLPQAPKKEKSARPKPCAKNSGSVCYFAVRTDKTPTAITIMAKMML